MFADGSGCSGLCGVLFCNFVLDVCFIYFGGGGVKMAFRSVEERRLRSIKRIKRLEEKQRALIDRIVYSLLNEEKRSILKWRICRLSKKIETEKNMVKFERRAKH